MGRNSMELQVSLATNQNMLQKVKSRALLFFFFYKGCGWGGRALA
jgi:hypothetical protein